MKKVAVFCLFILSIGCSSEDGERLRSSQSTNSITIYDVTPKEVTEGINTEFTIVVDYELATFEEGEINIGFNINEPGRFTLVESLEISKGLGRVTFEITQTPIDYSAQDNSFAVYANISEFPHPTTWTPLDTDFWNIEVAQQLGVSIHSAPTINNTSNLICYIDFDGQCIEY